MKIFNGKKEIVCNRRFDISKLDFSKATQDMPNCRILLNDANVKKDMSLTAWESIQSEWCGSDDSKLKVYLYIDLMDNEFKPYIQLVAFPYLPPEEDIQHEVETACEDCREGIKAYYEEVKDYYKDDDLGEFISLDMELNNNEQKDLLWNIGFKLTQLQMKEKI